MVHYGVKVVNVAGVTGLFYIHTDHLGSSTALSAENGSRVGDVIRYEPFGELRSGSSLPTSISDRGFTGHKHNDAVELIYMNARFYVPSIGRFASADTLVPDPADPQTLNRYSYTQNNPLNFVDPSGHCSVGTYLTGTAEDCWNEEEKGTFANWFVVNDEYIFDVRHVKSALVVQQTEIDG